MRAICPNPLPARTRPAGAYTVCEMEEGRLGILLGPEGSQSVQTMPTYMPFE